MFGIFGFQNFGRLGELQEIHCHTSHHKDLIKSLNLIIQSFLIAAISSGLVYLTLHYLAQYYR
ncbi:MAG: hypothetical protein LC117_07200 [Bacteroidia bacterium]|nr:hypothetical protein [Bacteroidia bacterium]MCZ2277697.1 hypothetical protein [Bacteroidia bacterium]